ncbi:hypothetical protein SteCoe_36386 [Stentor coeruleus]|uniref:Casein kinase I n=1 Tax=Stentor coeruleus TaxID=5963 RepID=A0A1R2AQ94_9CILI|nr:hypothetical protein SteCoe_36386 [Stentor coeruleus]
MQENSLFLNQYLIESLLGSGGFGSVYKATHLTTQLSYAIKVDKKRKGNVKQESAFLYELQGGEGIVKVYEAGETEEFTYMIMELLGPSLSKIQKQQGGKFSLDTVIPILIQSLYRLQYIHSFGVVHRDLKPQQFLVGPNNNLYLVDYGLARKFIVQGTHIPYQSNCSRAGNSTYASLNNHIGIHQTRRDDIESLAYMAVSLMNGRLPWQQSSRINSSVKWNNVYKIKSTINLYELCQNCPSEFVMFIQYARALDFHEEPDYEYLRRLIKGIQPLEGVPEPMKKSESAAKVTNSSETAPESAKSPDEPPKSKKQVVIPKSKSYMIRRK